MEIISRGAFWTEETKGTQRWCAGGLRVAGSYRILAYTITSKTLDAYVGDACQLMREVLESTAKVAPTVVRGQMFATLVGAMEAKKKKKKPQQSPPPPPP